MGLARSRPLRSFFGYCRIPKRRVKLHKYDGAGRAVPGFAGGTHRAGDDLFSRGDQRAHTLPRRSRCEACEQEWGKIGRDDEEEVERKRSCLARPFPHMPSPALSHPHARSSIFDPTNPHFLFRCLPPRPISPSNLRTDVSAHPMSPRTLNLNATVAPSVVQVGRVYTILRPITHPPKACDAAAQTQACTTPPRFHRFHI